MIYEVCKGLPGKSLSFLEGSCVAKSTQFAPALDVPTVMRGELKDRSFKMVVECEVPPEFRVQGWV